MSDVLVARPEVLHDEVAATHVDAERKLSILEHLFSIGAFRKGLILLALAVVWEIYGRVLANPLLFPSFSETVVALAQNVADGTIPARAAASLQTLLIGYVIGTVAGGLLATLAIGHRMGADLLEVLTSMLNPLPAVALLPLALIWFGLGQGSVVFVLVHSVLWAIALNTHSGFKSVSATLKMVGLNCGLRGLSLVRLILIPAALPAILTGLKVGWAFAWRTLIAAELVFGVSSGSGGLGWFIYENRNQLETANVFAGLLTVILIGLFVENVLFAALERRTIRRWGMQH